MFNFTIQKNCNTSVNNNAKVMYVKLLTLNQIWSQKISIEGIKSPRFHCLIAQGHEDEDIKWIFFLKEEQIVISF